MKSKDHSHYDHRDTDWRSNFGQFGNYGGLSTAHACLSSAQFPNTSCVAATAQAPIVAGPTPANTLGSGTIAPTGIGI